MFSSLKYIQYVRMTNSWIFFLQGKTDFQPIFSADPLMDGWRTSADSHFQVSPETLDGVQVRAVAGPFEDVHRHSGGVSGCVLRLIVSLGGKTFSPSLRTCAHWSRFSLRVPFKFPHVGFPSTLTGPLCWKTPTETSRTTVPPLALPSGMV